MEVFLARSIKLLLLPSLLHVRGGVSDRKQTTTAEGTSSPRPWRCFGRSRSSWPTSQVFSTSVEVFLIPRFLQICKLGLLHVRGGVSTGKTTNAICAGSSPRPWRCFACCSRSLYTVFGLLHVRGGVSGSMVGDSSQISSSPRPWRCFFETAPQLNGTFSLLHVRGGVSIPDTMLRTSDGSSPRPWRCFPS